MKKTFFILGVFYAIGCQSYENYVDDYGEPDNHFIYSMNDYIDNPGNLLDEILIIETDSGYLINGNYSQNEIKEKIKSRETALNNFLYKFSDQCIMSTIDCLFTSQSFREYYLWSILDNSLMASEGIAFSVFVGNRLSPFIIESNSVTKLAMLKNSKKLTETTIIMDNIVIYGERYTLHYGNDLYGYCHIKKRHTPYFYEFNQVKPNKFTNLFLESSDDYLLNIFEKIPKTKWYRDGSKNMNHTSWHGEITCQNNIKRTYQIVVDNTTKDIVTIYPLNRISLEKIPVNCQTYKKVRYANQY